VLRHMTRTEEGSASDRRYRRRRIPWGCTNRDRRKKKKKIEAAKAFKGGPRKEKLRNEDADSGERRGDRPDGERIERTEKVPNESVKMIRPFGRKREYGGKTNRTNANAPEYKREEVIIL